MNIESTPICWSAYAIQEPGTEPAYHEVVEASVAVELEVQLRKVSRKCEEQLVLIGKLMAGMDRMLDLAQGTRIREVQAMNDAKWDKHHRDSAQEDWNELNEIHRSFHDVSRPCHDPGF